MPVHAWEGSSVSVWQADVTSLPHCNFLFSLSAPSGGHSKDVVISVGCPVLPREDLPPGGGGATSPSPSLQGSVLRPLLPCSCHTTEAT